MEYYLYSLVFIVGINNISCSDLKSSLTFVIDDTYSMSDDIVQVKINADAIFDTVMHSNFSQIEDYVLATFNDPGVSLRTVTKDRPTFKNALKNIKVHGGDDCPEMAMAGVELALQNSREGSFLYVFTDASAKDYDILARVEALGQKKRSQIVFVLTGDCGDRRSPKYLAYHKLARSTQGQVFHMEKKEIGNILEYVKYSIESRKNVITSKTYPAGYNNKFDVNVDGEMKELVISVAGVSPAVGVTDPDGKMMSTEDITRLREIAIVKVRGVKPGVYKVEVGSESETNVVVSGTTTIHFQHGFSVFEPTVITDTATRPIPGENSYISIKLNTEGGKVELQSIQLLDMDDNVVLEKPLRLLNGDEQFYATDDIVPPNHLFRIAIKGYHRESKTLITRFSLTPIQPQDLPKVAVPEKAAKVSIDEKNKIEVKYNEVLQLKCKFNGYPKPDVIWESDDPTAVLSHTESVIELPSEFISILNIEKVKKSSIYTCKAVNRLNTDSKSISVAILEKAPEVSVEEGVKIEAKYKGDLKLKCKISGYPRPEVIWESDDPTALLTHTETEVSPYEFVSLLHLEKVKKNSVYTCKGVNKLNADSKSIAVTIPNKAPEVSIEEGDKIEAKYNEVLRLKCKFNGYPKPDVFWESDDPVAVLSHTESVVELPYEFVSVLYIKKVKKSLVYTCKAMNILSTDSKSIAVVVQYFNVLEEPIDTAIEYKKPAQLFCKVDAFPPATVHWYKDHRPLVSDPNAQLSADNSTLTIRSMEPYVAGDYICEIRNDLRRKVISFTVSITGVEKPKINKNVYYFEALKHSSVNISCDVFRGKPAPTFTWFYSEDYSPFRKYIKLDERTATLRIRDVGMEHNGMYRCKAENTVGQDYHDIDLIVEYPPEWSRRAPALVAGGAGEAVTLACPAHGAPPPAVTWRRAGAALPPAGYRLFRDGSLRFTASLSHSGNYECEAKNKHGAITLNVTVDISVPVTIEPPKRSRVSTTVGNGLVLPCRADGHPAPRVAWLFHSPNPALEPKNYTPSDSSGSLHLEIIQQAQDGFYTCVASNVAGSKNITYTVSVLAPPSISYSTKQFTGVVDDVQMRLRCRVSGNPKPSVTWSRDGNPVPLGSPWYDIEPDGSLLLKDVDARAAGSYECRATNSLGTVAEAFEAIVKPSPDPALPGATVWLQEGQTAAVACDVPHRKIDRLRWFKDGRMIANEELLLKRVSRRDAGLYMCRVSSFADAQTGSTRVEVGSKPRFVFEDEKNIEFEMGNFAMMSCDATGEPKPEIQWLHDDVPLDVTSFTHEVEMTGPRDKGRYTCIVSNTFGSVQQEFMISSFECALDIRKDFDGNEPLMLTRYLDPNQFDTSEGYVHIKRGDTIALVCPATFKNISRRLITVECVNGKQFAYDGKSFSYSDLKCREKIKPVVQRMRRRCTEGDSELMSVGFSIPGRFIEVYQVCVDRATRNPIYTRHNITSFQANVMPEYDIEWFGSGSAVDSERLYDCGRQSRALSSALREEFHARDGCCFARRQLVSARDVAPGLPQAAAYSRLNVAPHWSTCNSQNWEEMERRVRGLARAARRALPTWTGAARALALPGADGAPRNLSLSDGHTDYQVPEFIWKVIQDPSSGASLAVVQPNVPDLQLRDAWRYRLCLDVCAEVDWMRNRRWRDPDRGYMYCCSLPEFERAFGLQGVFPPRHRLLKAATYFADGSALHL